MPVSRSRLARLLAPLAVLVALAALPGAVRADDRTRAAEHFALAQSAEKRQDWRAAIQEYEEAYRLSPHPSVLYNIAVNHERLRDWRAAARAFLRYLDSAGDAAEDRDAVLARVRGLREKPSQVSIQTRPTGATISIDGEKRGVAPLTVTLEGGRTVRVVAEHEGRRAQPRQVAPEYGDALSITIDLHAAPGLLRVEANVRGAEVRLDGQLIGHTPYAGEVPSGEHQLIVALGGHRTVQRSITVPAQGSEEIRAQLEPIAGAGSPSPAGPRGAEGAHKLVSSNAYGYHAGEGGGARVTLSFGYRTPGNRFEIAALFGVMGGIAAAGAEARLYLATGPVRPYVRGALLLGQRDFDDPARAAEAGGGLLLSTAPSGYAGTGIGFSIDYFVEVSGHWREVDEQPDLLDPTPEEGDGRFTAILVGIGGAFGR